jgi:hypothetical protein
LASASFSSRTSCLRDEAPSDVAHAHRSRPQPGRELAHETDARLAPRERPEHGLLGELDAFGDLDLLFAFA